MSYYSVWTLRKGVGGQMKTPAETKGSFIQLLLRCAQEWRANQKCQFQGCCCFLNINQWIQKQFYLEPFQVHGPFICANNYWRQTKTPLQIKHDGGRTVLMSCIDPLPLAHVLPQQIRVILRSPASCPALKPTTSANVTQWEEAESSISVTATQPVS